MLDGVGTAEVKFGFQFDGKPRALSVSFYGHFAEIFSFVEAIRDGKLDSAVITTCTDHLTRII